MVAPIDQRDVDGLVARSRIRQATEAAADDHHLVPRGLLGDRPWLQPRAGVHDAAVGEDGRRGHVARRRRRGRPPRCRSPRAPPSASGIAASSVAIFSGSFIVETLIGVATAPDRLRPRLRRAAPARHRQWVSILIPPLDRQYGVLPGIGQSSCTEVMLMIRPPSPWAIICLAASWVPKKALLRLISSPSRTAPRCRGSKCGSRRRRC